MAKNPKTPRLVAYFNSETLELVRFAAELQGRSVKDFVVAAALEVAQRTLEKENVVDLPRQDQTTA